MEYLIIPRNDHEKTKEAIPTTEIVSHPYDYLPLNKQMILISFTCSGYSPKSIATLELFMKSVNIYILFMY